MRRTSLALLLGAVLLIGAAPALARSDAKSPTLIRSQPADGEAPHQAPASVSMTFSEPLDASSKIEVRDECNRRVDGGSTRVNLNEMSVSIAKKPSGRYVASYSATGIGGVTGTTTGSISFTVHMGPSCDGSGGGHAGHGDGSGAGKKHGGHKGGGGHGSGSGTHSGSRHSSGTHSSPTHAAGSGHTMSSGEHGHGRHGKGKRAGKHGKHGRHGKNRHADDDGPATDIAAPGDLIPPADGNTLLLALGASILLGAGGGLLVRVGVRL